MSPRTRSLVRGGLILLVVLAVLTALVLLIVLLLTGTTSQSILSATGVIQQVLQPVTFRTGGAR